MKMIFPDPRSIIALPSSALGTKGTAVGAERVIVVVGYWSLGLVEVEVARGGR